MEKLFEVATREKFRFKTTKGLSTTEDLYDLPLTSENGPSLDDVAKTLNKKLKDQEEESFVVSKDTKNVELEQKFAIVKHIIKVRLAEIDQKQIAAVKRTEKARLLELIAKKKDEVLGGKSLEDLKKMVNEL